MSAGYRVSFVNVGRAKVSWDVVVKFEPDEVDFVRMVRKKGALLSKGIDCEGGIVYAGPRPVGTYSVAEVEGVA